MNRVDYLEVDLYIDNYRICGRLSFEDYSETLFDFQDNNGNDIEDVELITSERVRTYYTLLTDVYDGSEQEVNNKVTKLYKQLLTDMMNINV